MSKPLSIGEFFQERQVRSAPGSRLSTNSEASRTYCPGQVLTEIALLSFASSGDALPSIVENSVSTPSQRPVKRASGQAVKDHEAGSDCSTADTADDVRTAVRLLIPSLDGTAQGLSPRTEKIGVPVPSVPPVQLRLEEIEETDFMKEAGLIFLGDEDEQEPEGETPFWRALENVADLDPVDKMSHPSDVNVAH